MSYQESSGEVEASGDKPALLLVHGSWSGAWVYDLLRPELQRRSYPVETIDLPLQDREKTYRDFGSLALSKMVDSDYERWVAVGHSSGANTLLWLAHLAEQEAIGRVALEKLIYVAPSPDGEMLGRPKEWEKDLIPPQKGLMAETGGYDYSQGAEMVTFDRRSARWAFFNDCNSKTARWAMDQMTPQFRRRAFSLLPLSPQTPAYCLIPCLDWTLQESWQSYVSARWLNVSAKHTMRDAGHFPMISYPEETAQWIDNFASAPAT